jgi:hypothetical protein
MAKQALENPSSINLLGLGITRSRIEMPLGGAVADQPSESSDSSATG